MSAEEKEKGATPEESDGTATATDATSGANDGQPAAENFTMEPTLASTRYQYLFGISAGLPAMTAGAWLGWPSSTIEHLKKDKILVGSQEVSSMVALMDFGNMLSPIPAGYIADVIGRKKTLFLTAVVYIIASVSVLVYPNKWLVFLGRIMAGLGKGIAYSVVPIYLAEIATVKVRGGLSTMFIGFLNFGMFYGYVIGAHVSYMWFNVAILVIPLIFIKTFFLFPESPYFLLMKHKEPQARKSLAKYRQVKKANTDKMSEVDLELSMMARHVEQDMKNKGRFIDLVTTSGNRKALLIVSMLAFFQRSAGISPTLAYSTVTMPETGGGMTIKSYMIVFAALLIVANYAALPLVDRIGRKPLLLVSSILSGIVTLITGVFYQIRQSGGDVSSILCIPYVTLILFAITYSIGIGFLPSTLVGELFPTNVKSKAGAISAIIMAAVSFIVNEVFHEVSTTLGPQIMYYYFTIASFACALFVQFFVFETKGKTFGEIQDILNKRTGRKTKGDTEAELKPTTEEAA